MRKALVALLLLTPQTLKAQATSFVFKFNTECIRDSGCEKQEMNLTFFLDDQGQAYMQGNVDLVQVMPLAGDQAFSFVEPLGSGAVQSTSVLADGTAIHSRHTAISGEFVASQWYGHCSSFGGSK